MDFQKPPDYANLDNGYFVWYYPTLIFDNNNFPHSGQITVEVWTNTTRDSCHISYMSYDDQQGCEPIEVIIERRNIIDKLPRSIFIRQAYRLYGL